MTLCLEDGTQSDKNLADAMARAKMFDVDLRKQSRIPLPESMTPPFHCCQSRVMCAINVIKGTEKEQVLQIIKYIRAV